MRTKFEHPSYGMISISRWTGGNRRLFGSALKSQGSTIAIRIMHGVREHELGRDWFFSKQRTPIVEIELSPAQFAELITGMNVGDGTPCTLISINGERTPPPPDDDVTETEAVHQSFEAEAKEFGGTLRRYLQETKEILEHKTITKVDRAEIVRKMQSIVTEVESNLPHLVEQFSRAAQKVVAHAKSEVEAYVLHNIIQRGFAAVQADAPKQLPEEPHD